MSSNSQDIVPSSASLCVARKNEWCFNMKTHARVSEPLLSPIQSVHEAVSGWFHQTSAGKTVAVISARLSGSRSGNSRFMKVLEEQLQQNVASPSLASVSSRQLGVPLGDVAMSREDVKGRLAPIAVYAVANPRNEFVLVSSSSSSDSSSTGAPSSSSASAPLGLFFFNKEDAHHLIRRVREGSPALGREAKVLRVTLDNVFEVFSAPREASGLRGIQFRFMPDMRQVRHALDLYRSAGVGTRAFVGVPVFQAEGLTVTAHDSQYVPLFLTREDLDVAAAAAHRQRNAAQIREYGARAAVLAEELEEVRGELATAEAQLSVKPKEAGKQSSGTSGGNGGSKALEMLRAKEAQAKEKLEAALLKASAVETVPPPKVEVGSLEEVIMRMSAPKATAAEMAAWSQVMFVAPDLLRNSTAAKELQASSSKAKAALTGAAGAGAADAQAGSTTAIAPKKPNFFQSIFGGGKA